jgi:hypothetical protein
LNVIGETTIKVGGKLETEALVVEGLEHPIYSPNNDLKDGCELLFTKDRAVLTKDGEVLMTGTMDKEGDHLYYVDDGAQEETPIRCLAAKVKETLLSAHTRLGHLHKERILELSRREDSTFEIADPEAKLVCIPCILAKSKRRAQDKKASRPLEHIGQVVSGDMSGKISPSSSGARYASVMVDHYSGYTDVRFHADKSAAGFGQHVLDFCQFIKVQTGNDVKIFRSDAGTECLDENLRDRLREQGVQQEVTAPDYQAGNGRTERKMRTLAEAMRAMMKSRRIPGRYWAHAARTACYIQNRTLPSPGAPDKVPHELIFGAKPDLSQIKEFGVKCLEHVHGKPPKLADKATWGVFLGYEEGRDGFLVMRPTGRTAFSASVAFLDEDGGPDLEGGADRLLEEVEYEDMSEDEAEGDEAPAIEASLRRNPHRLARPEAFVAKLVTNGSDSPTLYEAIHGPDKDMWLPALEKEVQAMMTKGVLEPVDRPADRSAKIIGSKMVMRIKRDADGNPAKHKARWTAQGFTQRPGVDYDETYAPTAHFNVLLTLLAVASQKGMHLHQMDVDNAYLNAPIQEELYLRPPPELQDRWPGKVLRIRKAIYGLRQSANEWFEVFSAALMELGWQQADSDPCLFSRKRDGEFEYLAIYVDDMVIATATEKAMGRAKEEIAGKFQVKDLGELQFLLGIRVRYDRAKRFILLDQKAHINRMLDFYLPNDQTKYRTPMARAAEIPDLAEEPCPALTSRYQSIIGSLQYVAQRTRPDITATVGILARFVAAPRTEHMKLAERILGYLRQTVDTCLDISCNGSFEMDAFSDSDWAGDIHGRKSTSGHLIRVGGAPVGWGSRKQSTVALSATEAEYVAMGECAAEAMSIVSTLRDLGLDTTQWIIRCDNEAAVHVANGSSTRRRLKHIDVKHHFLRDLAKQGTMIIQPVRSKDNLADLFTKPLSRDAHWQLAHNIGIKDHHVESGGVLLEASSDGHLAKPGK